MTFFIIATQCLRGDGVCMLRCVVPFGKLRTSCAHHDRFQSLSWASRRTPCIWTFLNSLKNS